MANVTTYTVGGSIANRSAQRRGKQAAQDWRYALDKTETETATGAETAGARNVARSAGRATL